MSFCVISNRSVLCMVFLIVSVDILVCIGEILEFLGKSSIFFSNLTSIYCEICEILIICHFLVSSSNLCVQVSGCWLQERRVRDPYLCICFLETIGIICLFITFYICLVFLNSPVWYVCPSDLIQSQTCCVLIQISSIAL